MDPASQALSEGLPPGTRRSVRAMAKRSGVPRSTLQRRLRNQPSIKEKAQAQQYLHPWEEKALVKFIKQQEAFGRPIRVKYVGSIAFSLARQRPPNDRPSDPPSHNWPQLFCKRHPEIKPSKNGALDWNRYHIYDKVVHWFEVIGKVLEDPAILQENVYNMDETGVMLSKLNSVKVLVSKENQQGYRGARVKRTTVTAIECVSADGRYLNPMIIWPASTHRANWTTHPTPEWYYAYSDSGYTDSYLSLQWLKLVFDPQTKECANGKPRVLICDGFGTHETLEILEFCFENNIILCRIPSHTSHKLQPCDISLFGPLKAAYRDLLDRLERGGVGTVGKEHFTYLYSPARDRAFTSRNIRSGWAKAGLFPFNPDKVLSDVPKPSDEVTVPKTNVATVGLDTQDQVPQTPVTPASAEAVQSLHNLIKQHAHTLDDEADKQRLQRHVQKLTNAAQLSFAECALLQQHNRFLAQMNNEAKPRRSTKSEVLGKARVMSHEDLEKARAVRAAKEAVKEAAKEAKKAAKEAKQKAGTEAGTEAKKADTVGERKRGRKRKSAADAPAADGRESNAKLARVSEEVEEEDEFVLRPRRAPVARMW